MFFFRISISVDRKHAYACPFWKNLIRTIKAISPIFGGINLEDISAPRCFEIEKRLTDELDIPIFHDDQHGAAGVSICKMLLAAGVKRLVPVDREGAIIRGGEYKYPMWQWLAQ